MNSELKQIQEPLKRVIEKMLSVVMTREEVEENYRKLSEIKRYDKMQKRQLMKQKYCLQDQDYDSQSDSDVEDTYKSLQPAQLKYLIREKLIRKKLCPKVLQKIVLYDPELEKSVTDQMQIDSATDLIETELHSGKDGEKMLNQANEVLLSDLRKHKNLKALKFIIQQLQSISKETILE